MNDTEKLFDQISRFVADSRGLLQAGAVMELAGLDDQVKSLCDAVLHLSQEDRIRYGDKLQQLLGELQVLGDELVVQRDLVANELRGTAQVQKAHGAYRKTDASDGYHDKGEDE